MATPVRGRSSLSPFNTESFRLMFEHAGFGMVVVDAGCRFIRANAAYCRMLGYTEEELQRGTVLDFTYPDDRDLTVQVFRDLARGVQRDLQKRYVGKDGAIHWTRVHASPIFDNGHVAAFVAVVQDITRDLETENELLKSETRFRAVFQAAGIGIALADRDGVVLESNPALSRMLGYTAEELRGMTFNRLTHPEDTERLHVIADLVAGRRDILHVEKRCVRKDGSVMQGLLTATAVVGDTGNIEFLLAMLEDVTGRKELEEKLRHAHKMESVGQLAGGVAHDFNNLLTVVLGQVYMGLEDPGLNASLRGRLQQIATASERAAKLTEQLLTFSRKRPVELLPLDMNQVVRDLQVLLEPVLGKSILLRVVCDASPAIARADRGQIEQVLINLAVNARDAMPDGGELTIATAHKTIADASGDGAGKGPFVEISVTDTGTGIPAAIQHRIFEPFFTTKEVGKGTGLGLATAYAIVEQHGGRISCRSQAGAGTTFSFCLPATHAAPLPETAHVQPVVGGAGTILVVEDEPAVLALVSDMLEGCGYKVLRASSAERALQICASFAEPIDLLLTDLTLPGLNGLQLADRLNHLQSPLKTIFMSGHSQRWLPSGSRVPLLQKPFGPATLYQMVFAALKAPS